MQATKAHIISQLQKDILLLQGFKPANHSYNNAGLDAIKHSFPHSTFPLGATHEFFCDNPEEVSSSFGFISGMLSSLMKKERAAAWISSSQTVFPPALKKFGLQPEQIIFMHLKKEKDRLWVLEETLKCENLCSVIAEISEISFTESRRLQLAVEKSKVTAFIIRHHPKNGATCCVTRWRVRPLPSEKTEMPGVGFPRWNVDLLKVRNGKTGSWQMEWKKEKFHLVKPTRLLTAREEQRKIG